MARHFLLGEVAKILGRRPHQIAYLITTGQVPEPDRRLANKRLFTEPDVARLARRLKADPDWSAVGEVAGGRAESMEGLILTPPFEVIRNGDACHEVRDGDGAVFCRAGDRAKALLVAGLLESAVRG